MTKEIAVFETKLPVSFKNVCWHPWINVREGQLEELTGLALHKHLRERGGLGDEPGIDLFVCIRDPGALSVDYTKFSVTPK